MTRLLSTLLISLTISISLAATIFYYQAGQQNLLDYDAIARLNISRKILDSLTPGIGQLGGVWLPFPQVLMLPFIWHDYFWRTGLAGTIVSSLAFIFGAFFLTKTAYLLTKNILASLFVWCIFVTNANIIFLQTTPLSELFFMFGLIMSLYFLTQWVKTHRLSHFLLAALFVMITTLTRYEGYFVFIASVLIVLTECIIKYRKEGWKKVEGMVLLFITVAAYGIFLWCVYCALFYKDPLYWMHLYSGAQGAGETTVKPAVSQNLGEVINNTTIAESFMTYGKAVVWTNGIIPAYLGLFGLLVSIGVLIKKYIKKQSISRDLPVVFISTILLVFLIVGYYKGFIPTIAFPGKDTLYTTPNSNIRYGLIVAPLIALLIGLTASRNRVVGILFFLLIGFQLYANQFSPAYFPYTHPAIPTIWYYKQVAHIPWFKSHYDGGLIMISANVHENFIFQTGLPYKTFIYEGAMDYWKLSLKNPAEFATWVIFDESLPDDSVNLFLAPNGRKILQERFDLVYDEEGFKIYRLKR